MSLRALCPKGQHGRTLFHGTTRPRQGRAFLLGVRSGLTVCRPRWRVIVFALECGVPTICKLWTPLPCPTLFHLVTTCLAGGGIAKSPLRSGRAALTSKSNRKSEIELKGFDDKK